MPAFAAILISVYSGSWELGVPYSPLFLGLHLFQYVSTVCICVPVIGSTKVREWLIVECESMFGIDAIWLFVTHLPV